MAEDIKEKIYEFLKENLGRKYNLTQLTQQKIASWASVSKWVAVLIMETDRNPIILQEDYGNVKLIWAEAINNGNP